MNARVLELTVNNHPGVMAQISGLFARRAFNIAGLLCGPLQDGKTSRMYILVEADRRLPQLLKQLDNLYDVQQVAVRDDYDQTLFLRIHEFAPGG